MPSHGFGAHEKLSNNKCYKIFDGDLNFTMVSMDSVVINGIFQSFSNLIFSLIFTVAFYLFFLL